MPQMTREQIIIKIRSALPDIRRKFAVRDLYLFGSIARGDDRPESDVDILVIFQPAARVTLFTLGGLNVFLEDLLGRPVDIVEDHPGLRPTFRAAIEEDKLRVA